MDGRKKETTSIRHRPATDTQADTIVSSYKCINLLAASTARSTLDALSLPNGNRRLVVDSGSPHALLNLACHGQERLLDVRGALRGRLEERNTEAISKFLYIWSGAIVT
jgi:hypothetical protein